MSLPNVSITRQDGGLGIVPSNVSQTHVKIGVCSAGTPLTLYSFTDTNNLVASLGYGPVAQAAALAINEGASPVYVLPVAPSTMGAASSVSHVGTGAATVSVAFAPLQAITITITTGGALGVGDFTYQLGAGAVSAPVQIPAGGTYTVPGTLTTLTFASGTYVAADTYTVAITGGVAHVGSGSPAVSQSSTPLDDYQALLTITTAGAPGVGAFTYSLDNGIATSAPIAIPSNGLYAIANTGLALDFSGTAVANDTYSFTTGAPQYSNSDLTTAYQQLATTDLSTDYAFIHVVSTQDSSSAAEGLAAVAETQTANLVSKFKFVRSIVECPTVGSLLHTGSTDTADTDTAVKSAFASFASPQGLTSVSAGDKDVISPLDGITYRRNIGWDYTARLSTIPASVQASRFKDGGLSNGKLYRDEAATPGLDDNGFVTGRSFVGETGAFITNAHTMAASTSDFRRLANCRVIDIACAVARSAALFYLNDNLVTNTDGTIDEKQARKIENDINTKLKASLVFTQPQNAVSSSVQVSRSADIQATSTLPITVNVQPFGYADEIDITIGFTK